MHSKHNYMENIPQEEVQSFEKAKCIKGNPCYELCCYSKCQDNAVICQDRECECQNAHRQSKMCLKIEPSALVDKVKQRRLDHSRIQGLVRSMFEELVEFISKFEDSLEPLIRDLKLREPEKVLLKMAKQCKFEELTGKAVSDVFKAINTKKQEEFNKYLAQLEIRKYWVQQQKSIKSGIEKIEKIIKANFGNKDYDKKYHSVRDLRTCQIFSPLIKDIPISSHSIDQILGELTDYGQSVNRIQFIERDVSEGEFAFTKMPHTLLLLKTSSSEMIGRYMHSMQDLNKCRNSENMLPKDFVFTCNKVGAINNLRRNSLFDTTQTQPLELQQFGIPDIMKMLSIHQKILQQINQQEFSFEGHRRWGMSQQQKIISEMKRSQFGKNAIKVRHYCLEWVAYQVIFN